MLKLSIELMLKSVTIGAVVCLCIGAPDQSHAQATLSKTLEAESSTRQITQADLEEWGGACALGVPPSGQCVSLKVAYCEALADCINKATSSGGGSQSKGRGNQHNEGPTSQLTKKLNFALPRSVIQYHCLRILGCGD